MAYLKIERFLTPTQENIIKQSIVYGELISRSNKEKNIELSKQFFLFLNNQTEDDFLAVAAVMLIGQDLQLDEDLKKVSEKEELEKIFHKYVKKADTLYNLPEKLIEKNRNLKLFLESGEKFINFVVQSELIKEENDEYWENFLRLQPIEDISDDDLPF